MQALQEFTLHRAASLAAASALLQSQPGARLIAGGTDLVPNMRRGLVDAQVLVDLSAVAGLDRIEDDGAGALRLGATVTLATLARNPIVLARCPALAEAAASAAGPTHRNTATLGGNLCQDTRCVYYNQGEWWRSSNGYCLKRGGERCHVAPQGTRCHAAFCSDIAPVLMVLGAQARLVGPAGRCLPVAALYRDDGAAHLALAAGEVLAAIEVPAPGALRTAFAKARTRGSIDFPLAAVAAGLSLLEGRVQDLRVALAGTNSHAVLLEGTGSLAGSAVDDSLLDALGKLVARHVSPMRSTVTPANYRRDVAVALARRLVLQLAQQQTAGVPA